MCVINNMTFFILINDGYFRGNTMHGFNLYRLMSRTVLLMSVAVVLTACTTQKQKDVTDVVATPLSDLNLIQKKIPSVLLGARKTPYALPSDTGCAALDESIHTLDEALGPDIDAVDSHSNLNLVKRGSNAAEKSMVSALDNTVKGFIPFRRWIRELSGAERHSTLVASSITAGRFRRAFIKGLRASKECS
jgi:hypothetical protein